MPDGPKNERPKLRIVEGGAGKSPLETGRLTDEQKARALEIADELIARYAGNQDAQTSADETRPNFGRFSINELAGFLLVGDSEKKSLVYLDFAFAQEYSEKKFPVYLDFAFAQEYKARLTKKGGA